MTTQAGKASSCYCPRCPKCGGDDDLSSSPRAEWESGQWVLQVDSEPFICGQCGWEGELAELSVIECPNGEEQPANAGVSHGASTHKSESDEPSCPECGDTEDVVFSSLVKWDPDEKRWRVHSNDTDDAYCNDCEWQGPWSDVSQYNPGTACFSQLNDAWAELASKDKKKRGRNLSQRKTKG